MINSNSLRKTAVALVAITAAFLPHRVFSLETITSLPSADELYGTTISAHPVLAGTTLRDITVPVTVQFYGFPSMNLVIEDKVVQENATNFIDFYFRIISASPNTQADSNGNDIFERLSLLQYGYAAFPIRTNYLTDQGGVASPLYGGVIKESGAEHTDFQDLSLASGTQNATKWTYIQTESHLYTTSSNVTLYGEAYDEPFQINGLTLFVPQEAVKLGLGGRHPVLM